MLSTRTTYKSDSTVEGVTQVQYGWDPEQNVFYLDAFDAHGNIVDSAQWENNPTRLSYLLARLDYYGVNDHRAKQAVKYGLPF
jgi:hypothetical protein